MNDANEDIFRRAAEQYPLNTANADWEAMRKKLDAASDDDDAAPIVIPAGRNKFWPLLLVLLLLSLVVIDNKYTHFISGKNNPSAPTANSSSGNHENNQDVTVKATTQSESNNSTPVASADQSNQPVTQQTDNAGKTSTNNLSQKNNESAIASGNVKSNTDQTENVNSTADVNKYKPANGKSPATVQIATATSVTEDKSKASIAANSNRYSQASVKNNTSLKNKSVGAHTKKRLQEKQRSNMQISDGELAADGDAASKTTSSKTNSTLSENEKAIVKETPVDAEVIAKQTIETKPVLTVSDSSNKKQLDTLKTIAKETGKEPSKEDKNKKEKKKHIYIGLLAGPDFSLIKLQSVYKTGISYGAILGYNINKRFSIETGYFRDKKYYSSQGKYFNTSKLPIPAGLEVNSVTGDCHMAEWPVNVYYHFSQKKKSSWFASAGISSYFMNKEYYVFNVTYYGNSYPYKSEYKTKDNQFAAVINLSAGFNYSLGKIGHLRLEPYVKLPVNKVGTGDLPIQSAGILIGLTKQLF